MTYQDIERVLSFEIRYACIKHYELLFNRAKGIRIVSLGV